MNRSWILRMLLLICILSASLSCLVMCGSSSGIFRYFLPGASTYVTQGDSYVSSGDLDRAISAYDTAISIQPDYAEAYYRRGLAYMIIAIWFWPGLNEGTYTLKRDHPAIGNLDQAILFDKCPYEDLSPAIKQNYSMCQKPDDNLSALASASRDFDQAIRLKPDFAEAYYSRGLFYARTDDLEKASADFQKALGLCGNSDLCQRARQALQVLEGK